MVDMCPLEALVLAQALQALAWTEKRGPSPTTPTQDCRPLLSMQGCFQPHWALRTEDHVGQVMAQWGAHFESLPKLTNFNKYFHRSLKNALEGNLISVIDTWKPVAK